MTHFRAGAKRPRITVMMLPVCGLLGLFGLIVAVQVWRASRTIDCISIWAGYEGVYTSNGGTWSVLMELPDRNGKQIKLPIIGIAHNSICYWSPLDGKVCILTADHPPKWIPVSLPYGSTVADIRASREGYLLNLTAPNYKVSGSVLSLSTKDYHLTSIDGVIDARSTADSDPVAMLPSGQLTRLPIGPKSLMRVNLPVGCKWDADPSTTCFTDNRTVWLVHDNHRSSISVGVFNYMDTFALISQKKQVWVSVLEPFSSGCCILAYNLDGDFLGKVAEDPVPMHFPMQPASTEDLKMLAKCKDTTHTSARE